MKKLLITCSFFVVSFAGFTQTKTDKPFDTKEVERIITKLASDDMRGRATFSPDIDKASSFISEEFKKIGLQKFGNNTSYLQPFKMVQPKFISVKSIWNNQNLDAKQVMVFTSIPKLKANEKSGYQKEYIKANDNFFAVASQLVQSKKNCLVLVDSAHAKKFGKLTYLKHYLFKSDNSVVFVLTNEEPKTFEIEAIHEIKELNLANVAGVLPGKKLKNEYVIFSGHYDHLGIEEPMNGDSIYNGANDDASGITAVISLAKYYKALNNNERSIIFVAFTAEEIGGFGSQYFSNQLNPTKVAAMFNIEMIGTESKWGTNSAYITGYEKTNMGEILQKNLKGSNFTFYPDPYTEQQLFYRSDNATLARQGVPAHTISTSKMDNEANYHKASDEVKTLDMVNMSNIIKSIAVSATSIINGKDTPSRVDTAQLR
ncbi:M20/M25/M40 family metallo-hydrolase [Solitalea sp. MAHUQ-68]|uniref:M20/M25/M40 family metallo-hydrolase n=1 Tax=Solitalea agri TaxID=2953739 RepID=A0A9X2EZ02_9SPHI|nr:M20/M25/M40 family metallo-hydrolase [Solitalea agri]MCO4291632.1 M20/M25/M40 family metallo-hydrolase [Solitalea agri]